MQPGVDFQGKSWSCEPLVALWSLGKEGNLPTMIKWIIQCISGKMVFLARCQTLSTLFTQAFMNENHSTVVLF